MRRTLVISALLAVAASVGLPTRVAVAAVAAPSWRTLSYAGETFRVPSRWTVKNLATDPTACVRLDRHAVYEGLGQATSCPPTILGTSEAVQIQPLDSLGRAQAGPGLRRATIGGQAALVNSDQAVTQRLVAAFPAAGVLVTVSYGRDRATAERVFTSFAPAPAGTSDAGRAAPTSLASMLASSNAPTPASTDATGPASTDTTSRSPAAVSRSPAAVSSPSAGVSSPSPGVSSPSAGVSSPSAGVSSPSAGVSSPSPAGAPSAGTVGPDHSLTPASGTQTQRPVGGRIFTGAGFDSCAAPSPAAMAAWTTYSPYRAVGVYIGGVNRACGAGYLSADWIETEVAAGWNIIPLYVGRQAACAYQGGLVSISSRQAAAQGTLAARNAALQESYLGMAPGSPIYYDMEGWNSADPSCSAAVVSFVKAWSEQLEREHFVPGIYGSADAGIAQDIAPLYGHPGGPEVVDVADWDGQVDTNSPFLSSSVWPTPHRVKQFLGGNDETYGGVTISVDEDFADTTLVGHGGVVRPAVSSLRPRDAVVGTTVTVRGRDFVPGATTVTFGAVPAAEVDVLSPDLLTAQVPVGAIATVDVTASTLDGSSTSTAADRFAYVPVVAAAADASGYWLSAAKGEVFNYGTAWHGSATGTKLGAKVVGMAADPATGGYWLATATGRVYAFDAPSYGGATGRHLTSAVVGIAADAATGGYRLVTAGGRVLSFHAPNDGSFVGRLPSPVVGIAADALTGGYRIVTSGGTVYAFDAPDLGSLGAGNQLRPIIGIAGDPTTGGYWLASAAGAVRRFDAPSYGSRAGHTLVTPVVAITATSTGYLLVTAAGNVFHYHTRAYGSLPTSG